MGRLGRLLLAAVVGLGVGAGPGALAQNRGKPAGAAPAPTDAKGVLRASRGAMMTLRTATYSARLDAYGGASAAAYPVYTAVVNVQRVISGSPVMARISVRGETKRKSASTGRALHMVYDGTVMRWLGADGSVTEAPPGAAHADLLGREEMRLVPADLVLESPLTHIIDSGSATYEGRQSVDGTECDVVFVEYTPVTPAGSVPVRARWFVGVEDRLPRRLEFPGPARPNLPEAGLVLTLEQLQTNATLEPSVFRLAASPPPGSQRPPPPALEPRRSLLPANESAPDWALRDADGKEHRLSDYKGKVVVLDFWATWCGPCLKLMPEIQGLHEKFKDRGAVVIGISGGERRDPVKGPADHMAKQGYTYGLLVEGTDVFAAYGIEVIPTLYVITADGKVAYRGPGRPGDAAKIERIIEQQLKKR